MSADDNEVTVMVQNPSYSTVPQVIAPQKRGRGSVIIFGDMDVISSQPTAANEFEKIGSSSKWDHHITLAVIATIISVLCLNILAFSCGVAAIYFSATARIASRDDKYHEKLENQRTSFAFFIICVITLIVSVCCEAFAIYESQCGKTGINCRF